MASLRVSDFRPNATLSMIERCGNSAKSWNIKPDAALLGGHEAVGAGNLLIVDQNAPTGRALDAGGDPEQGGLAAARRPEQADHLARLDIEAHMIEREALAEAARHVIEGEPGGEGDGGLAAASATRRGRDSSGGAISGPRTWR